MIMASAARSASVTTSVGLDLVAITPAGLPGASRRACRRLRRRGLGQGQQPGRVRAGRVRGGRADAPAGVSGRQQSAGQVSQAGPSGPSAAAAVPSSRSRTRPVIMVTNLGSVPGVAARCSGSPSRAAASAASVSRSCMTSMWSDTKPTGTSTAAASPAAASSAR